MLLCQREKIEMDLCVNGSGRNGDSSNGKTGQSDDNAFDRTECSERATHKDNTHKRAML